MTEDEVLALLGPLIGKTLTRYVMVGADTDMQRLMRATAVKSTRAIFTLADETDDTWRSWMVGTLDGIPGNGAPVTAIREGRYPEVFAAARRFVTDPMAP